MNRSVTIFLCAVVVWAVGLGETSEAGLKRQEECQTEIGSSRRPAIPEIAGDYVLIYKSQPDVYTGKDTKNYRAGQRYTNRQPNDHTFIKGPDNRWHCFGITRKSQKLMSKHAPFGRLRAKPNGAVPEQRRMDPK